jgi:hypothetical protein
VIVRYFYVMRTALAPDKADAPLIVDTDAVLPLTTAMQFLQAIGGRGLQIAQLGGGIEHGQFAQCRPLDGSKSADALASKKLFRLGGAERNDHTNNV